MVLLIRLLGGLIIGGGVGVRDGLAVGADIGGALLHAAGTTRIVNISGGKRAGNATWRQSADCRLGPTAELTLLLHTVLHRHKPRWLNAVPALAHLLPRLLLGTRDLVHILLVEVILSAHLVGLVHHGH